MAITKTIDDKNALLIYTVGPVHCCSPALNVETIILPPTLHHTPGSQDFAGVFHHARGMVSVIDLRQRFGVDQEDRETPGRIVIAEISGGLAGFWVDDVGDVCSWPQQGWNQTPPLVPRNIFKRTLLHKTHIHLYADFEDLFKCREYGYLRQHIQFLKQHHARQSTQDTHKIASQPLSTLIETTSTQPSNFAADLITPSSTHVPSTRITTVNPKITNTTRTSHSNTMTVTKKSGSSHHVLTTGVTKNIPAKNLPIQPQITTTDTLKNTTEQSPPPHTSIHLIPEKRDLSLWYFIGVIVIALTIFMVVIFKPDTQSTSRPQTIVTEDVAFATNHTDASSISINSPGLASLTPAQDDVYQASIVRNDEGITITLDEPENFQPVSGDDIVNTTTFPDTSALAKPFPDTMDKIDEPAETRIIHVVVKGDTLWDIAKHYIHNPWRYPELAKLSKISNPHRIYPGDKIKIIIRKKANGHNQPLPAK